MRKCLVKKTLGKGGLLSIKKKLKSLLHCIYIYILFETLFSKSYIQVALSHAFFSHIDLVIKVIMVYLKKKKKK
jgi:hypothetical protein